MSLNRLTVRAKKSFSNLFSFSQVEGLDQVEPDKLPRNDKENDAPELEEFGSLPPHTKTTWPDVEPASPLRSSPSRRKKLIGSLKRIGSLRSIRSSPGKMKNHDEAPLSPPESPRTPTRYVRHSLALNFKESPPGEPMFDLSKPRRSMSSGVHVHHSSPISVPLPVRKDALFMTPIDSAILPAGTVPTTPAPLQKALERDTANMPSSPLCSPSQELGVVAEPLLTPMPGTNLAFEDIHPDIVLSPPSAKCSGYFDIPLDGSGEDNARRNKTQHGCEAVSLVDVEREQLVVINKPHQETAKPVRSDMREICYYRENVRRYKRSITRSMKSSEEAPLDNIEHVVYEEVDADGAAQETDSEGTGSRTTNHQIAERRAEAERRLSSWGRHSGLYDGTGYGDGYSSRPSTSVEGTPDASETAMTSEASEPIDQGREDRLMHDITASNSAEPKPRDPETLSAVHLAYAAFEGDATASVSASSIADDIDLANRMMDSSLGA